MKLDHLEHDIFLLMLSLSQVRSPERIRQIFLEALNSFWDDLSLCFAEQQGWTQDDRIEIALATTHHSFGYMLIEGTLSELHDNQLALIRNAAGMLALILENRLQASLLAEENIRLDEMVQERTSELLRANEELKREITERKQTEERIHYLARLVENVSDAVISTNMDLTIKTWNKGAEHIYGWQADDVLGRKVSEVTGIEYLAEDEDDILRTLVEQGFWKGEIRQKHKDGRPLHILASISLLRDDSGEHTGTVAINKDITERKHAEEKIRQLNEGLELRVKQRTAELETVNHELKDFAHVVSHDLKAPLRAINQIAHWLEQDYGDTFDAEGENMLTLLMQRVLRMDRLIDGILQYSRLGRLQEPAHSVDLNEVLRGVIDAVAPPAHIDIRVTTALPVVTGDYTRLSQVFQNLLSNAVKFMDKPHGNIQIACRNDQDVWSFRVADNGPGIEQKHYEKIFHIFETLQPRDRNDSTGIGLSLVKKIVELYGGEIWVDSTVGKGSTFFFTIPKQ